MCCLRQWKCQREAQVARARGHCYPRHGLAAVQSTINAKCSATVPQTSQTAACRDVLFCKNRKNPRGRATPAAGRAVPEGGAPRRGTAPRGRGGEGRGGGVRWASRPGLGWAGLGGAGPCRTAFHLSVPPSLRARQIGAWVGTESSGLARLGAEG